MKPIRDTSHRLVISGPLFGAVAMICAACASIGDQQALQDVPPNPEILERIEARFAASRREYPELSLTRRGQPESLSRDEAAEVARGLDELGAMLHEITALDAEKSASRHSLRYVYKGESLSLEDAAGRLTADLDAARRRARALKSAPTPVLGGPEPRIGEAQPEAPSPAIEVLPEDLR